MASACISRRRLRVKTAAEKPQQKLILALDDWEAEEKHGARKQVYLVTFPHPKASHSKCGVALATPSARTKRQILECLLDARKDPIYTDARNLSWKCEVQLKQAAVFQEFHAPDATGVVHTHYHVPVLAQPKRLFGFLPVKKALLSRHGLATHWSRGNTNPHGTLGCIISRFFLCILLESGFRVAATLASRIHNARSRHAWGPNKFPRGRARIMVIGRLSVIVPCSRRKSRRGP